MGKAWRRSGRVEPALGALSGIEFTWEALTGDYTVSWAWTGPDPDDFRVFIEWTDPTWNNSQIEGTTVGADRVWIGNFAGGVGLARVRVSARVGGVSINSSVSNTQDTGT